jgi:raffinose/stachyose/melibiose transport system substrate-binding protein
MKMLKKKGSYRMNKKTTALGLIVSLTAVLLAGCGDNANNETSSSASAPASNSASPSASASGSEAATLRYLTWDYSDRTASTDAWIKKLKDTDNITIDMQNVPTDQYNTTMKTKFAAMDLPDLVKTHGIDKELNLQEKLQVTADQFVDLSDLSSVADFLPSVIADRKSNKSGKLLYVPTSTNALGVLYNKKLFSDNGVTVPTNIDELTTVFEKLKSAGVTPLAGGFKDAWLTQIIPFIAFGQYVNASNPDAKVKLSDGTLKYADIKDAVVKALNVQLEWKDKGYFQKDILGTDANVASQMVGTGKAAMIVVGTWQLSAVQGADPSAEIGFFPLPLNAPGEKLVLPTSADEGIMINAASKNVEAAKKALNEYLSAENQALVIADLNGIPTNTKVEVTNPFVKEVQTSMTQTEVQPDWWGGNGFYQPSGTTFNMEKSQQSLLAGGVTPEQFIKDYDAANAKALKK